MGRHLVERGSGAAEEFLRRLLTRLEKQALWDSLLLLFAPLVALTYPVIFLYRSSILPQEVLILAGAVGLLLFLFAGVLRLRYVAPSIGVVAQMIDQRVEGRDRFLTLATVNPSDCPANLVSRLRQESAGLLSRIDLREDFPYRMKRSVLVSSIASLVFVLLFHLLLQPVFFKAHAGPEGELALLAQKLAQAPGLAELARRLESAAHRVQEKRLPSTEKQVVIQEMRQQVEKQLSTQQARNTTDLLNRLAELLRGLEQGPEKGQEQSAGDLRTNLPQEKEGGREKAAKGGGGEGGDRRSGLGSGDLGGGRPEQKEKGADEAPAAGNREGGAQTGKEREKGKELETTAKGELEGKGGRIKMGEEIPRGKKPERYSQRGEEGSKGVKGSRFVTVQLPEEETDSLAGEAAPSKKREVRPKVPVTNLPLRRPDSPDLAPEKQPIPLEYRGLIR